MISAARSTPERLTWLRSAPFSTPATAAFSWNCQRCQAVQPAGRRGSETPYSTEVNPGTPVGAKYPGTQIIALANWATEAGLGAEPADGPIGDGTAAPIPAPEPASDEAQSATVMQKTIAPSQVTYYLERGYDRVSGFVNRASEVDHLRTPAALHTGLGLGYPGSPFSADADEVYVLRWPAYRPMLYRVPFGGQTEAAMEAMEGWVIERAPFRGNGFAPSESSDVVAEFKIDSTRLPHGAQLWRLNSEGIETLIALDKEKKLISRDIIAIDLRLPEKVIVRLSDAAAKEREEFFKKDKRKGGNA